MKFIAKNRVDNSVFFSELECGETFRHADDPDGKVLMKFRDKALSMDRSIGLDGRDSYTYDYRAVIRVNVVAREE